MSDLLDQYKNEKLWHLDRSKLPAKIYVSVPIEPRPNTAGSMGWGRGDRRHLSTGRDVVVYTSGEYEIRGEEYARRTNGTVYRRSYVVWRQGVELPLSFTGSLREAKSYAWRNARGEHRVNVA